IMRALVACGWFGIQCWIGGEALHTFFGALWSPWPTALGGPLHFQIAVGGRVLFSLSGFTATAYLALFIFLALNVLIVFKGMDLLRKGENWAAPYVLVMTAVLVGWAVWRAHGLGSIMAQPGKFADFKSFFPVFIPSLTAMIGFWATLSLNMPDFTR